MEKNPQLSRTSSSCGNPVIVVHYYKLHKIHNPVLLSISTPNLEHNKTYTNKLKSRKHNEPAISTHQQS